jgi:hypothetical protein
MTTRGESGRSGGGSGPRNGAGPRSGTGRRITPGVVFLVVALVGSAAFVLYSITVRDTSQIPLLAAGSAVLGIVFVALAAYGLRSTWQAGVDGRSGQAIGLALGGGIAAIIGAGCLAGAIILFLLSQKAPA